MENVFNVDQKTHEGFKCEKLQYNIPVIEFVQ